MVEVVVGFIEELNVCFFEQLVLNAMGVVYPQFWLQPNVNNIFPRHLKVLKSFYCTRRPCGVAINGKLIQTMPTIFSA
jgi:hypothetical protein